MADLNLHSIQLGVSEDSTKNFIISVPAVPDGTLSITRADGSSLGNYANDTIAAAASPSVPIGGLYRNGSILRVRVI